MLRILVNFDDVMIRVFSSAIEKACLTTGLTYPFFLLLWRACFCGAVFMAAVVSATMTPSALSYGCLALAIVLVESFRRQTAGLWRETWKEWDKEMFLGYALACMVNRERLFGIRMFMGFVLALVLGNAVEVVTSKAPGAHCLSVSIIALMCASVFSGGYVEASMPPIPGGGDPFAMPEPSVA